ncbi:MAG: diacylglycerol kinase [Synergistaceae bacterium]
MLKNSSLFSKTIYSINGLIFAFKSEKAIRNESTALILTQLFSFYMNKSLATHLFFLFMSICPVIVEMINTSIEITIDKILGENYREEVRQVKDILSAAVFLSLFSSYGCILFILIKNINF